MRLVRHVWNDVRSGQNLDVYIAVTLSLIVAILGVLGVADLAVVSSAVLATLALFSISVLTNRRQSEELQEGIEKLMSSQASGKIPFFRDYDRMGLANQAKTARKMFLWGFSWTTTIPTLGESIMEGVGNGLEMRFLLIQPSTPSARMATFGGSPDDESDFDLSLRTSLLRLYRLQQATSGENVQVRTVDLFPPCRIIAIDPHLPTGQMIIRLTSLRDYRNKAPVIQLKRSVDQEWFDFFVQQFECAWQEATPLVEEQYKIRPSVSHNISIHIDGVAVPDSLGGTTGSE